MDAPLAYDDISPSAYIIVTTATYLLCVLGGVFISDLGFVFEMITAFAVSFSAFIWPGLFYLVAYEKYGKRIHHHN